MNAQSALPQHYTPHAARLKGIFYMLIAVGAFACLDTLLKLLSEHYSTAQVLTMRGAASVPFFVLPLLAMRRVHILRPVNWRLHIARGFLQILTLGAFVYALRSLSLADTYAIFLSAPLIVTAISVPLFKEQVGWKRWTAIAVGLGGVLVMLKPSGASLITAGAIAALISAASYAISVLGVRMLTRTDSTASIAVWPLAVMSLIVGVYAAPSWKTIAVEHWLWVIAAGGFGALGMQMLTEAFRLAPPSVVAPFEYTALIYGALMDWVLWSTLPSTRVYAGGGLVIASGLYLIWRERQLHLATRGSTPATQTPAYRG